jgi:hypothetical protein
MSGGIPIADKKVGLDGVHTTLGKAICTSANLAAGLFPRDIVVKTHDHSSSHPRFTAKKQH